MRNLIYLTLAVILGWYITISVIYTTLHLPLDLLR